MQQADESAGSGQSAMVGEAVGLAAGAIAAVAVAVYVTFVWWGGAVLAAFGVDASGRVDYMRAATVAGFTLTVVLAWTWAFVRLRRAARDERSSEGDVRSA